MRCDNRSAIMRFFSLSLLVGFLTLISLNTAAQCTKKLEELPPAPELLGFRLGMNRAEVKALVPQTSFGHTDDFGVSKTTINPFFDPTIDKTRFAGVRSISLDFLDERLTSIWIGFDETYRIQELSEFARSVSESLKLPNDWAPYRTRGQQMRCSGFQLILTPVARGPSLRLLDLTAEDTIAARRQEKEERDAAAEAAAESAGETGSEEVTAVAADKKTKTYYPISCDAARKISVENRIFFKSAQEAEKVGFKIGKGCD